MMRAATEARGRRGQKGRAGGASGAVSRQEVSAAVKRVNDAVRPCLVTVTQLMRLKRERRPPPEMAYQSVRTLLAQTMRKVETQGTSPEDQRDIKYALVAFIDEMMQSDAGPMRDFWSSHLLQLEHFSETRAGEGFFEKIESFKNANRPAVLRVYYLCLLFGFHGIYGQHGELERENLIETILHALNDSGGRIPDPVLAPNGPRPDEPGVDRERNQLLQWLAVAAAIMAVFWYVGLVFTVDAQERTLSEILQSSYEDLKAGLTVSAN